MNFQQRHQRSLGAQGRPPGRGPLAVSVLVFVMALGGASFVASSVEAKSKKEEEEVDFLTLAARMIADGKIDRASQMLEQVDTKAEGVELKKYYTLLGLVQLKQGAPKDAVKSFEAAIQNGQEDLAIHLYLAQAHFGLKNYQKTIDHLKKAGPVAKESPNVFGILAQSYWELKQRGAAFAALDEGIKLFPKDTSLLRAKIFYLVDLGLYQEVVRLSADYLQRPSIGEDEYLAISEALRRGKQLKKAQQILTQARLKYPDSARVAVQLAHAYVDDGQVLTAAMLFEEASRVEPKYALEAAELYKQAGRSQLALTLNSRVVDQNEKLKQRLSLLLDAQRYEMISGMADALSRNGLLKDDNVRYALAFAYYKLNDFDVAEEHLRKIKDPDLFRAAAQLRKAMASCREAGWECF